MTKWIEAVPNFSEGRDLETIDYICKKISEVEGVKILHTDIGYDANRTVVTFVAPADKMVDAAFNGIKAAAERIDMSSQKGEHPRIGATDVMPFIPLQGSTIEDCIEIAHKIGSEVAEKLHIPVYCYEEAAFEEHKRNLAMCRKGEYEGIASKLNDKVWQPDYGEAVYSETVQKSGISVIGARNFLLAVNFNLTTDNINTAKEIAKRVRYSGYIENGKCYRGSLEGAKAIGWYMEQYGFAQVSMNIVDIRKTSLHEAFLEVSRVAELLGTSVSGTEIIGMLPLQVVLDAGSYFAGDCDLSDHEKIELTIEKMNFNQITQFDPDKKIIELAIKSK